MFRTCIKQYKMPSNKNIGFLLFRYPFSNTYVYFNFFLYLQLQTDRQTEKCFVKNCQMHKMKITYNSCQQHILLLRPKITRFIKHVCCYSLILATFTLIEFIKFHPEYRFETKTDKYLLPRGIAKFHQSKTKLRLFPSYNHLRFNSIRNNYSNMISILNLFPFSSSKDIALSLFIDENSVLSPV